MIHSAIKKTGIAAAAGLLVLAVSSTPARASHGGEFIAPLAAFIVIGALAHHHHHGHYRYRDRPYYRHYYRSHRRYSHSRGGYRAPRYKHYRNW